MIIVSGNKGAHLVMELVLEAWVRIGVAGTDLVVPYLNASRMERGSENGQSWMKSYALDAIGLAWTRGLVSLWSWNSL